MASTTHIAALAEQPQERPMGGAPHAALGFEAAYDAYGLMVYRLAMVYLGSRADAEDVTQEAFIRLLGRAPAFTSGEHEKRWLLRVTVNLCRDQLKGFWHKRAVELEPGLPAQDPESLGLAEAIVALPEQYKGPIHLHYCEGYSVAEIGEILHLGQSAVKMRLMRGRELLRKEMEG
ncbi:MAG: RNA polymerase sigma factor [Oscillospiraceae bacterium]|jgi:RNA polymerase sigma factor (sigma-70 family)|nr:RNA polymerase sigma factor [Oscillospiraceae bacterium]